MKSKFQRVQMVHKLQSFYFLRSKTVNLVRLYYSWFTLQNVATTPPIDFFSHLNCHVARFPWKPMEGFWWDLLKFDITPNNCVTMATGCQIILTLLCLF